MSGRRVAVTGLGVMTPLGCDVAEFWLRLCSGVSGVGPIQRFDASDLPVRIAAEIHGFDPDDHFERRDSRLMDRYVQLGVAAGLVALQDAGLTVGEDVDPEMVGIIIGSGSGGMDTVEQQARAFHEGGMRRFSPYYIPAMLINMVSAQLAIRIGAHGPTMTIATACAAGSHSIGEGYRKVQSGEADVMLVGGSEAPVFPQGVAGFCAMRALSTRQDQPQRASRPFDAGRDGFVLGEGAGVLVLEALKHARARGARVYAELVGYGSSTDAYHATQPQPDGAGAALCMRRALRDAGLHPSDVQHINTHGTSTKLGDISETKAIHRVFGAHAPSLLCSSTKSMTGHLLGAAGAIEAVASVLSVVHGVAPPTINLDQPDPACDLDYVPGHARQAPISAAMSNSFAFGGHNSSLVFRATKGQP